MTKIRVLLVLLIVLAIINCTLARARNFDDLLHREKRYCYHFAIDRSVIKVDEFRFFGCARIGKKCSGFWSKSCCGGLVCHRTTRKCVRKGSSTSWLGDRNGK